MVYKFLLFLKFIKYSKLKFPLYGYSFGGQDVDTNILNILKTYDSTINTVKYSNRKDLYAILISHKKYSTKQDLKSNIGYFTKYEWIVLGYINKPLIKDCTFKQFEEIYSSLFYPQLSSQNDLHELEEIRIADKLNTENISSSAFIICKII